jgi:uncharacterized membrane protein
MAAIPLYGVARSSGRAYAGALVGAYLLGLGVARGVSFDFHIEAFAPLLAFIALWGLTRQRRCLRRPHLILTLKEDAVLLTLTLCWIGWFAFRERISAPVARYPSSMAFL